MQVIVEEKPNLIIAIYSCYLERWIENFFHTFEADLVYSVSVKMPFNQQIIIAVLLVA